MALEFDLKLRLVHGDEVAMGPGKAALLEAIDRTGSISAAARSMNMSYRRAWLLVEVMNRCFAQPVVARAVGGAHGGGAHLTPTGGLVLAEFRKMEAVALAAAQAHGAGMARLLK
jgi:molybdate transport system regulatory protein